MSLLEWELYYVQCFLSPVCGGTACVNLVLRMETFTMKDNIDMSNYNPTG